MHRSGEPARDQPLNEHPGLGRIAPDHKLHRVRFNLRHVLDLEELLVGLDVAHEVPPVPRQVVVGARSEDRVLRGVLAAPDVAHHVFCGRGLKEVDDLVLCYQVKGVTVFEVFF